MSWAEYHSRSENLAAAAQLVMLGEPKRALELYAEAAMNEALALDALPQDRTRTLGITAVSAVALWFKARRFAEAQALAYRILANQSMPPFAVEQVRDLLQVTWSEETREKAGFNFAQGAVLVSVSGGQSVRGGAPLDLVVGKVEGIQAMFYRTVEYLQHRPHRKRGAAPKDVQSICRPWLFQAAPGSYQFAVAIENLAQGNLFETLPTVEEIKSTFIALIRESADNPASLSQLVTDREYRGTFLKMVRALAPSGKDFQKLTIRDGVIDSAPITLAPEVKATITRTLQAELPEQPEKGEPMEVKGVLRGLQLNRDWIEVTVAQGQDVRIWGAGDTVDDIVGPLVNKDVVVQVVRSSNGRWVFRDIEAAL